MNISIGMRAQQQYSKPMIVLLFLIAENVHVVYD